MYGDFASVYDLLNKDAETEKRAKFTEKIFKSYGKMPTLMLDLACGSGEVSAYFAKKGVSVIGVDISPDMLSVAREKTAGLDILYLNQDMTELDLYGTVNGAVCTLDSLNHLNSYKEFCTALKKVSLFLESGCLFIFDLNTPYKHKTVLGNNTFIKEGEGVFCAWQNEYEPKDKRVNINLDFFVCRNGSYQRTSEQFSEIAFSDSQIERALSAAGLKLLALYDGDTFGNINQKTQRIIYVTGKA